MVGVLVMVGVTVGLMVGNRLTVGVMVPLGVGVAVTEVTGIVVPGVVVPVACTMYVIWAVGFGREVGILVSDNGVGSAEPIAPRDVGTRVGWRVGRAPLLGSAVSTYLTLIFESAGVLRR